MEERKQDLWSQQNYIQYILSGKKAFHTPERSWLMKTGDAFFVKKGAAIVEKVLKTRSALSHSLSPTLTCNPLYGKVIH